MHEAVKHLLRINEEMQVYLFLDFNAEKFELLLVCWIYQHKLFPT